ncbi:hypothetical protein PPYR_07469 [Photinus pyralis]|uniref:Uncharacterized protein n=2 Tax=Photinus pyralis TaxID=7054 RepID=A0A1Y1LUW1_PHOPY|nr:hypothetical protein PPYR_07469 [Photinus pyralis]
MRTFMVILISLLSLTLAVGKPQKDQPKEPEISNSVNPEAKEDEIVIEIKSTAAPEIHENHFHRPGAAVVRIIDDIFQIPIGVLQSVSRLLKNPFVSQKKTPETISSY